MYTLAEACAAPSAFRAKVAGLLQEVTEDGVHPALALMMVSSEYLQLERTVQWGLEQGASDLDTLQRLSEARASLYNLALNLLEPRP